MTNAQTLSRSLLLAVAVGFAPSPRADGQDHPVILQWFECPWADIEHRAPDFFNAGYGALWLPPPSKCADPKSPGYDPFERFDLGTPTSPTAYGTEAGFRAATSELRRANGLIYIDTIMNHNSMRQTSKSFQEAGGYPGFWMASENPPRDKLPTDNWGDFHAGHAAGYYQSEDPGKPFYDREKGDLVALIDIAHESNNLFIRHPVKAGHAQNIPEGTLYNKPNPANARLYQDRDLPPRVVHNPGTSRNPPPGQHWEFFVYPFNTNDPSQGDPIAENATLLLLRWTQWMLDEFRVDGFRLDAAKHVPTWFWDTYWDTVVHERRLTPDGRIATPFSFVECVDGNWFTYTQYVRKDAFADRDALDLSGAGSLRDVLNADGFGSWASVLAAHIDTTDDGFNNGTLGVNHVFSHDNGSAGNGSAAPPLPTRRQQGLPQMAYALLRPGPPIVYHNARGITRSGGFFPREGSPNALGLDPASGSLDPALTTLVRIRNEYARGQFFPLNWSDPVNQSMDDALVYELSTPLDGGAYSANLLVAVNDRFDNGVQQRNVLTTFPPGTRLHELTGNAADLQIDPTNLIPEILTVGADRRVLITVPNNRSVNGLEHAMGYVVYGPAVPSGVIEIPEASGLIPADPPQAPFSRRRLSSVPVVNTESFTLRLTTMQTDPLDPNTDDDAIFRINEGHADLNGNGATDYPYDAGVAAGYERFTTTFQPLYGSGHQAGLYEQVIDASLLPEGYNYVSVLAFRHRNAGDAPLFREFRTTIYIDRVGPKVELLTTGPIENATTATFRVALLDRTAQRVHFFWNLPPDTDPIPLLSPFNQGVKHDRFEWRWTESGLTHGLHTLTVVPVEVTGTAAVERYDVLVLNCAADVNGDTRTDTLDFLAYLSLWAAKDDSADMNGDGAVDTLDFILFLNLWVAGC
ncbi:MAG: hypothetical protein DYG93_04210 [Leptolyngbya sp. PLA2]|nr:hypothetical protein [Leptolyngbya sp.]MCE7970854.1 hypothetical protein [Leptolyngbya sp. PL-A2]MCQ3940331.1 hypothetical protein [cyanobacterium CYA1]MCZ7633694.1 hypothetical protein [Phycisphaerales bacterium]MDL1904599.1 hypothetical protein [Synechococcales cyanobacterium CNB]GIK17870.1 MAG: hypothetical protein BroJett004_00340 [Planctomycetota bacterium]